MISTITHIDTTLTPDQLKTDLRQLSLNIVREMYLASQKLLAYSISHPAREKTVNSAFLHLRNWLQFKFYYQIETDGKTLWTEKIMLEDNYFVRSFVSLLWKHHLKEVKFYDWITPEELSLFIDSLNPFEREPLLCLSQHNITSIEINPLIQRSSRFVAEPLGEKYTVENLAQEELERNPSTIIKIALDRFDQGKVVTNFRKEVLYSVAGKVFAGLSPSLICQLVEQELKTNGFSPELAKFMQLVNEHPQRELLLIDLDRTFRRAKLPLQDYATYFEKYCSYPPGESNEYLLKDQITIESEDDFLLFLSDLLKAGEYNKFRLILDGLIEQLTSKSITTRSKSLSLVKSATPLLMADQTLVSYLNGSLIEVWDEQKQTFEILDALCFLAESSLVHQLYSDFKLILDFLKRKTVEETSPYKQEVFRKALIRLTGTEVVNRLIGDMNKSDGGKLFEIGECLRCISTREVAERLSRMTNHPHPARRVMSLGILAEMGNEGKTFVSQLLTGKEIASELEKERIGPKNRVRIFEIIEVLSRAKKKEGIELLRKLCQSRDTEVRLKIASGLKDSYDPKVLTLLRGLAVDTEPQVRLEAIRSLKNKVSSRDLEWLKAIYFEEDKNLEELICVIANLNSEDGDRFLFQALTQDKRLRKHPHCQIRILEVLSKRGKILPKEQTRKLKYELERKSLFPFKKLILRRRVNQLILQLYE
ncbi:MAG: HEAT repeat domain-containing protein [candidate division Zixibacteria bacterium]|nr:HEAT repeat domain-containing protein [candidate division Zixibacteria bacterium]